ncbi:MAG TPA: cellulase family glycosylhydrolase [Stellaceae bacterium]|nr:cellulase family glycosylhydrolase [Stellaceae bacterium]
MSRAHRRTLIIRRHVALAAVIASLILAALPRAAAAESGMLHAGDSVLLDAGGSPLLLRCVNLGAWLNPEGYLVGEGSFAALTTSPSEIRERLAALVGPAKAASFWQDWTRAFVAESDFKRLKEKGFNCVRLPLTAKTLVAGETGERVLLDAAAIAPVDRAVAWGAAYGIYVFLDLHDAPGGQNSLASVSDVPSTDRVARLWQGPTAAQNRRLTIRLWHALAQRYAEASVVGGYDLLNEPELPTGIAPAELARLYDDIIAAIRTVDHAHLIVLEGNHYAHDFAALGTPADANVMYEFHEYALFNRAWRAPTQQTLQPFLALRAATKKPLWLGEFGEETAPWQANMVRLMQANGIGWAVWPWKRIDFRNGHPVIATIAVPPAWKEIAGYLVGRGFARKPPAALAEQAMAQMLEAIRTANCREDEAVEKVLAGE